MTGQRRIGLLGGTFDPIHMGHLDLADAASRALGLTDLLVIPANVPPHRAKPLTSAFHRFAMVAVAVAGRAGWRACDVELRHESPSYTATTLRRFHERGYEPSELVFLIGADAFASINTWRDYPHILDRAHFGVVSRPRFPVGELPRRFPELAARMAVPVPDAPLSASPSIFLVDAHTADVSSTTIRTVLANGGSVSGMLDPRVQEHIEQHGLYRDSVHVRGGSDDIRSAPAGRLHGQD